MSSLAFDPYRPTGQLSHDVALSNGSKFGCAMNVPGEQHPKRPVDVRSFLDFCPSHWPPHNVRVNPLPPNTLKKKRALNGTLIENTCTCIISAGTKGKRGGKSCQKKPILKRGEKVYVLAYIPVTLPSPHPITFLTSHVERSPLKATAPENTAPRSNNENSNDKNRLKKKRERKLFQK